MYVFNTSQVRKSQGHLMTGDSESKNEMIDTLCFSLKLFLVLSRLCCLLHLYNSASESVTQFRNELCRQRALRPVPYSIGTWVRWHQGQAVENED